MAVVATQIKKGQCIEFSGEKLIVLDLDHRTPGKEMPSYWPIAVLFNQVKLKLFDLHLLTKLTSSQWIAKNLSIVIQTEPVTFS